MKKHKNINMLGCCLIAAFSFITFSVANGQNQKHLNTEKENNINNDKVIKVSPISQDQTNVDLLKGQEKNNLLLINNKNDEAKRYGSIIILTLIFKWEEQRSQLTIV